MYARVTYDVTRMKFRRPVTYAPLFPNEHLNRRAPSITNSDCFEVDPHTLEMADYENDYAGVAADKLLRKCATN
jgi:hypothetical protein